LFFFIDFIVPNDDIVLTYDSKCVVNISLFTFGLINIIWLVFELQVGLSPQGDVVIFNPYFIKFWMNLDKFTMVKMTNPLMNMN
jgi:hypothetical protein